jgi:NADPH-dependent ferric siderophore reductase
MIIAREYTAQGSIGLKDPEPVIAQLCEHMLEHNAEVSETTEGPVLRLAGISARFSRDGDRTLVDIVAPDLESLCIARMTVASHILEFSGDDQPDIAWTGDGGDVSRPPNFQLFDVVACRAITPHMRRLTLAGENVARFAGMDALHLNLMVQQPGVTQPQWPHIGPSGMMAWDDPDERPFMRKYTVRSVDLIAGVIDIDFVLHEDAGPGSRFAEAVSVGDRVGVLGPGGGGLIEADWYLFAGDETALPAIARMLEHLPGTAVGRVLLEVADAAEIQQLEKPAAIEIEWLLRDGRAPGTTTLLADAVRTTVFPTGDERRYVWVGCEFETFRTLRNFVRQEKRMKNDEHLVVSYWRRGMAE